MTQSLIKDAIEVDACPRAIYYKYVEERNTPPSDAMFKGLYFEHYLLGATRDGETPVFEANKTGKDTRPAAQRKLDEVTIPRAKVLMEALGINITRDNVQLEVVADRRVAHIDLLSNDIIDPTKLALYDVKHTDTDLDDRWRGWADFDSMWKEKFQAVHYAVTYHESTGLWLPFYFLVFGGGGWVRIIKVEITEAAIANYNNTYSLAEERLNDFNRNNWPPVPAFNKCTVCPHQDICDARAKVPEVETFQI